ncbi:TetR/AcrR family transcriptional regulator [Actinoallomurus rhizosphaericola]|uniref:TetR/AcrR family transcriptional regulator n=1 Tax=Actinoallomurus rhizosphaericola TaxID=2952536 RepID=UPI002093984B|nr:TetR/AcrR family transcriptional regulator [Actinoallomurus rhizosphaericola]MCO5998083.1 TetR/AcrR family transcriptional regulator [Actinoallomurus rhizosphaericola]
MAVSRDERAAPQGVTRPARPLGRKRDHSRDAEILQAARDVLAETGYEGMTVDMVAVRAKAGKATVYRRWATKEDLVLAAVACLKDNGPDSGELPDTGTLRGDLLAMIDPHWLGTSERRTRILAGLASMIAQAPELAQAVNSALVEPSAAAYRHLMRRAVDRGEVSADADVDTVAQVIPSMAAYRVMFMNGTVDRPFMENLINRVVLPALGLGPS